MATTRKGPIASLQSTREGKGMKRSLGPDDWDVRLAEVAHTFRGSVQEAIDVALWPVIQSVTETATILDAVKQEVVDIASSMKQLTARQDITRADLRQQKDEINQCNPRIDAMQDKMADLENRNRRCNVRLVGLPEVAEGESIFFSRKFHIGIRP
ncbi:UNVERIFIED_CONTAM: hypothetical protein FKN15_075284 [Acipenser sinensis]